MQSSMLLFCVAARLCAVGSNIRALKAGATWAPASCKGDPESCHHRDWLWLSALLPHAPCAVTSASPPAPLRVLKEACSL